MRYAVHLFDVAATCCLKLGRLSNFRATFDLLLSTNQLVAYTSQLKSTKPHNRTINLLQATNQPEVDPCMPALMLKKLMKEFKQLSKRVEDKTSVQDKKEEKKTELEDDSGLLIVDPSNPQHKKYVKALERMAFV